MAIKSYSKEEIAKLIDPEHYATVNKWLARGDGIAHYENHDLGHFQAGHSQFVSFGSDAAQIEAADPPLRLPDIGGKINWRYRLVGTYKGEALS